MTYDPNSRQVGGTHYSHASGMQHWDLMALADAGYFAGQVTKYTERHSRKNGKEDLEKALHFAEKWLTVYRARKSPFVIGFTFGRSRPDQGAVAEAVRDYAVDNNLTAMQERIFEHCLRLDGDVEEVVRLCKTHLLRVYGDPELSELSEEPVPPVNRTTDLHNGPARTVHPDGAVSEEFHIPTFLVSDDASAKSDDEPRYSAFAEAVESALTEDLSDFTGVVAVEDDGSVVRAPEVVVDLKDALDEIQETRYVDGVDYRKSERVSKRRGKV